MYYLDCFYILLKKTLNKYLNYHLYYCCYYYYKHFNYLYCFNSYLITVFMVILNSNMNYLNSTVNN